MPQGDSRKGPQGQGPLKGRCRGKCSPQSGTPAPQRQGGMRSGRGQGRGSGIGSGQGQGKGHSARQGQGRRS